MYWRRPLDKPGACVGPDLFAETDMGDCAYADLGYPESSDHSIGREGGDAEPLAEVSRLPVGRAGDDRAGRHP
jgi:hypothetical protein